MRAGHCLRDHSAHGGADDVRFRDPQRGEQAEAVIGHVAQGIWSPGLRGGNVTAPYRRYESAYVDWAVIEHGGQAAVTVVVADHVPAAPREHRAEVLVPPDHLRPESNHEQDGRITGVPERVVGNGNPVRYLCRMHTCSLPARVLGSRAPAVVPRLEELAVGAVALAFQVVDRDKAEGGGVDAVAQA